MKRTILYSIAFVAITGLSVTGFLFRPSVANKPAAPKSDLPAPANTYIAAPGLVEPVSEEFKIGSELTGKLQSVLVDEGDRVQRGQIVAVLEHSDYEAQVASAEARVRETEAELRRVINGARGQERREAQAGVEEAQASLTNARSELERKQALFTTGDMAKDQVDRAERDYQTAVARLKGTEQRHSLVNADPREEDRAKAQAAVQAAHAQLSEARAQLNKTSIRSPLAGVVLRRYLKTGESVANSPNMPVISIGDVSTMRVRVDVDESDVGKLQIGQRVYVMAAAYGNQKFWGRIARIGQIIGKKNIRTDEPTERVDTKILETLVDLDDGHKFHPGLRVDSFIDVSSSSRPNSNTGNTP